MRSTRNSVTYGSAGYFSGASEWFPEGTFREPYPFSAGGSIGAGLCHGSCCSPASMEGDRSVNVQTPVRVMEAPLKPKERKIGGGEKWFIGSCKNKEGRMRLAGALMLVFPDGYNGPIGYAVARFVDVAGGSSERAMASLRFSDGLGWVKVDELGCSNYYGVPSVSIPKINHINDLDYS